MVIIQNKAGQLANRLFVFSHFIANAIEYKYTLFNPTFGEYCKYFYAARNNDFGGYPIYVRYGVNVPFSLFRRFMGLTARIVPRSRWHEFTVWNDTEREFNLNEAKFIRSLERKIVITNGWLFRDYEHFAKHAEKIRFFFTPDEEVMDGVGQLSSHCRQRCDILIGVHVRRGDYGLWQGGRYSFENSVYLDKMLQLEFCFSVLGKRVAFLICSNDSIDEREFGKVKLNMGLGHEIWDLYSLARCDYIIGPPSTYSMWASYYGKVPLLHITDPTQQISLEEFLIASG